MPRVPASFPGDYLLAEVYVQPLPDINGPFRETRETPAQQVQRFEALRSECPSYVENILAAGYSIVKHAAEGGLEELHELILELRGDELTLHHPRAALYAAVIKGQLHVAEYLRRRGLPVLRAHDGDAGTNLYEQLILNWIEEQEEVGDAAAPLARADDKASEDALAFIERTAQQIVQHGDVWRSYLHLYDQSFLDATTKLHFPDGPKDFPAVAEAPKGKVSEGVQHKHDVEGATATADEDAAAPPADTSLVQIGEREAKIEDDDVELAVVPAPLAVTAVYVATVLKQSITAMRKYDGCTPLHLVAEAGWPEAVAALLLMGADVHSVSSSAENDTPLSIAQRGRRETGCDAILEAAGAAAASSSSLDGSLGTEDDTSSSRDARQTRGSRKAARRPTPEEVAVATVEKRRYDMVEALIRLYGGVRDWKLAVRRGNERYERKQMAASLAKLAAGGLGAVTISGGHSMGESRPHAVEPAGGAGSAVAIAAPSRRNFTLSTSAVIAVAGGESDEASSAEAPSSSSSSLLSKDVGTSTAEDSSSSGGGGLGSVSGLASFSGGFNADSIRKAYANAMGAILGAK